MKWSGEGGTSCESDGRAVKAVLAVVLSALLAACAADGRQTALERELQRTQVALNAATDADSLAAAAELSDWSTGEGHPKRFALLTRAAASAPDRPDLVWLEIEACHHVDACDPTRLVETLHRLDPENGAAWASLLDAASRRGDAVAMNRYLEAIASSKRFDIYWNESIAHLTAAVLKVGALDATTALTELIGTGAAFALPPYHNIAEGCSAPATNDVGRRDVCRSIATVMRNSDTYITEMVGIAIATRVWPQGSSEFTDAVGARRVMEYRMSIQAEASIDTDAGARSYLALLTTHRTEQEVVLAVIAEEGKSPDPPADWNARWRHNGDPTRPR